MRSGTTSPLYAGAGVGGSSAASQLDDFRVRDLTGPWTDDYGISHARYAGAQAAGRTFIHPARTFIAWTQTTLPTVGTTIVEWRRQDANNLWRSTIDSAGNWLLIERAAGVDTTRITGSGVAAGHRCVIGHDGADLRLYSALTTALILTARGNYLTAAAHDGQTAGELTALGTGGAVSDLVIEPRDVAAYLAGV
jgi:hypothetical protein